MADIVQMRLEQMLPEIEDLEKKKIFNKVCFIQNNTKY